MLLTKRFAKFGIPRIKVTTVTDVVRISINQLNCIATLLIYCYIGRQLCCECKNCLTNAHGKF
jgi:hypothetical protein